MRPKKYIKIVTKEIKLCETQAWPKVNVLILTYKIWKEEGTIKIKDFIDTEENYWFVLEKLNKEIKKANYDLIYKWKHGKKRKNR